MVLIAKSTGYSSYNCAENHFIVNNLVIFSRALYTQSVGAEKVFQDLKVYFE